MALEATPPPPPPPPPTEGDPLIPKQEPVADGADDDEQVDSSLYYQLEQQRRKRLQLALTLVACFAILIGMLLVWRLQIHWQELKFLAPQLRADAALSELNAHRKKQSKHIHKWCESTLILLRHCEKQGPYTHDDRDGSEHCSYIGYERASHLASLFGETNETRWPTPAHLFALTPDRPKHLNFREWETLEPLSKRAGVVTEIVTMRGDRALPQVYFDMLRTGALCGKLVVASWKHELISELANELACGPYQGCPRHYSEENFDQVWQLKYVFHPDPQVLPLSNQKKQEDAIKASSNLFEDDDGDNEGDKEDGTRRLRHRRGLVRQQPPARQNRQLEHEGSFSRHGWTVYATVSDQNFDPLAYSKQFGDYPPDGAKTGGRWMPDFNDEM